MSDSVWAKACCGSLVAVLLALEGTGTASAQHLEKTAAPPQVSGQAAAPPTDPAALQEMQQRIENLEKANQNLMQRLEQVAPADFGAQQVYFQAGPTVAAAASPAPAPGGTTDYAIGTLLTGWTARYVQDSISSWGNGLIASSPNKDFIYHVGGCLQTDTGFFNASPFLQNGPGGTGPFSDGVTPRRFRLRTDGTIYEFMDFAVEAELVNGFQLPGGFVPTTSQLNEIRSFFSPGLTDGWIRFKELPFIGNLRVGNQKEPISLERLNNFQDLTFMERSVAQDAFAGANVVFAPGIMIYNTYLDKRGTWWLGVFKNIDNLDGFGDGDGQYAFDARLTYLPIYINNGDYLWHVGGAFSHRDPINGVVTERTRDPIRPNPPPLLPNLISSGPIAGTSQDLFYLESSMLLGPATINAEYTQSYLRNAVSPVTGVNSGTYATNGGYVELLTFLTADHRTYDVNNAVLGRVHPRDPFFPWGDGRGCCGKGAWEVGIRYSYLNLNQANVISSAGNVNDLTLGLNWYLNTMMKLMFNYDHAWRGGTTNNGTIQALGARMQISF